MVTRVHPRRKSLNAILRHGQKTILAPFLYPYNLSFTRATPFIEFASNSRLELNIWMKHTNAAPVVNLRPDTFNSQRSQLTSKAIANLLVAPCFLLYISDLPPKWVFPPCWPRNVTFLKLIVVKQHFRLLTAAPDRNVQGGKQTQHVSDFNKTTRFPFSSSPLFVYNGWGDAVTFFLTEKAAMCVRTSSIQLCLVS